MSSKSFQFLYEGLCSIIGAPAVELPTDAERPAAFHLDRNGVVVNVLHFPQTCPDHAHVLIEFGPIPFHNPRVSHIVLALLDINFLLPQPHPPAMGRNPATGDVVLRSVYPLDGATPSALLEMIDQGVELALQWRADYFLGEAARHGCDRVGLNVPVGGLA